MNGARSFLNAMGPEETRPPLNGKMIPVRADAPVPSDPLSKLAAAQNKLAEELEILNETLRRLADWLER